jgi:signal transduction histidine kinase
MQITRRMAMNDNFDQLSNLNFFGKITASVTHELNNVFSIINEYNGLLEDQIFIAESELTPNLEKLSRIQDRLAKQIARGETIIRNLNKFAHSTDHEYIEFDLNDYVENILNLTTRLANLKKIKLTFENDHKPVLIVNNPYEIMRNIFLIISYLLDTLGSQAELSFSIESNDDHSIIFIRLLPESDSFPLNTIENLNTVINTGIIDLSILQKNKLQIKIQNKDSVN